jgi:DNA-binding CsgD family transcriptional regulator
MFSIVSLAGTWRNNLTREILMAQFNQLSNREWEVVKLLLQGKSNKLIALSLGISDRTVEFHLKNIYAKFQVNSRIELILKLGNATGGLETTKLGHSTVAGNGEVTENRDRLNLRMNWATSLRETVSTIGKELEMKTFLNSIFVGTITSLITGFLWLLALSSKLLPNQIRTFIAPLIIIWLIIGVVVGLAGRSHDIALVKVSFSALCGTGLSPFVIVPIMLAVVLPIGYFAETLGLIDPSTMPSDVGYTIASIIMIIIWLIAGSAIGIMSLFVRFKKPEAPIAQSHVTENGS